MTPDDKDAKNQYPGHADFLKFRDMVLTDEKFRDMLGQDPEGALQMAGIKPTPELLAALQHAKAASEHLHRVFGEGFHTTT